MIAKNTRRQFLKTAATATAAIASANLTALSAKERAPKVAIVLDPQEGASRCVRWAAGQLRDALKNHSVTAEIFDSFEQAPPNFDLVLATTPASSLGKRALDAVGISLPDAPEALGLAHGRVAGRPVLVACGSDARGLLYALLELADLVHFAADPLAELKAVERTIEQPANAVRSLGRAFVSETEDKPWFYDREMWPRYLAMLATQRFNRFNLTFGIGYDFLQNVRDAYFLFAYPFLLSVPGYDVRVPELPAAERDRNLEMLKYISEQAVECGLQFQLGLWMHGYE